MRTETSPSHLAEMSCSSDSWSPESNDSADDVPETPPPAKKSKPSATRGIFELQQLKTSLEKHSCCPRCGSGLVATFPTCCIATSVRLECCDKSCGFIDTNGPSALADVPLAGGAGSPLIERSTDYAVNMLHVIGFLASGDGGAEAGRLLGMLGLPNSTTMEKRSFAMIEKRIGPTLQRICDEMLRENLEDEVAVYCGDEENDQGVLLFDLWKQGNLPTHLWPRLWVSADVGWQKRSSGRSYNSLSGHALFVATLTRKPIVSDYKSRLVMVEQCTRCDVTKTNLIRLRIA